MKHLLDLHEGDLKSTFVWVGSTSDRDETSIRPATRSSLKSIEGKIVACSFRLNNGAELVGVMSNLTNNVSRNAHLANAALLIEGKWFFLARYHDAEFKTHGPAVVALRLKLPLGKIFPITYEVLHRFNPPSAAQRGVIHAKPKNKLTRKQIIELAVP
jgi:hypothetical protein